MNPLRLLPIAVACLVVPLRLQHAAEPEPKAKPASAEWKLVWSDEFEGEKIDRSKWEYDLGNGFYDYNAEQWIAGWGNGELEYYTREPENSFVESGMLHIRAIKESWNGSGYTSARLKTRKRDGGRLFDKLYGRFEVRAKLPIGRGVWPGIWMLPQSDRYGTWASSGEIDIVESKGQEPDRIHGTIHFGSRWPANASATKVHTFPEKQSIAEFHTYALEWEPGEIRWLIDGEVYSTQKSWWSSSKLDGNKGIKPKDERDFNPWPAPFDQPFYLVMNVAVGGQFGGKPDAKTTFPVEMVVDYVRVYDKVGGYGKVPAKK